MKKRALSLLMALIMVVSLLPTAVWAADGTLSGSGTEADPYLIASADDLKAFRDKVNAGERTACAKLTADINLNNEEWTPIGGNSGYATEYYSGDFDGNGKTISNFSITKATYNFAGFFSYVKDSATIHDLKISKATISSSKNNVGGIVGTIIDGTIQNCSFDGAVTGTAKGYAGGIAGYLGNQKTTTPTIKNCANLGSISAGYAGGITGYAKFSNPIQNCYNSGAITGQSRTGGIVGQNMNGAQINSCFNIGSLSGTSIGAICGFNGVTNSIINCYWTKPDNAQGGGGGTSDDISKKVANISDVCTALGTAFTTDASGNVILTWEASGGDTPTPPPPAVPSISISSTAGTSIWDKSWVNKDHQTKLSVSYENMGTETPDVTWRYPQDSSAANFSIAENTGDLVVTAWKGGVVEVTANVTFEEKEYSATMEITVIPQITTVEIKNVKGGAVAVDQDVTVQVFTFGGDEYDYENYPPLSYQWYKYDGHAAESITGATGKDYHVDSTLFAGKDQAYKLGVEVTCNGKTVHSHNDQQAVVRSADHGKLYPVAYDQELTLPSLIKTDSKLTLPASHTKDGVKANVKWSSDKPGTIAADGTVARPTTGKTEVTLTAKFTYGNAFYNRTFTITVWSQAAVDAETELDQLESDVNSALDQWYKLYPVCGTDENVLEMVKATLAKKDLSDIDVSIKKVEKQTNTSPESSGIDGEGKITYFYIDPNTTPTQHSDMYHLTLTFTRGSASFDREEVPVIVFWDRSRVEQVMTDEILPQVVLPESVANSTEPITKNFDLPKVACDETGGQKRWALISWESSDPAAISISTKNQGTADTLFDPYEAEVHGALTEKDVTLTATCTFQFTNDTDGEKAITMSKVFNVTVGRSEESLQYVDALDQVFNENSLKDITGKVLTSENGVYSVCDDIKLPTTVDMGKYMMSTYKKGFDGKYTPIVITSSNPDVIKNPDVGNVARLEVYRPDLNGEPVQVSFTVKILSRPSGEGRDYDSMPVLAEKTFTVSVQPITQEEIDAELALMQQVKEHYWDGIKKANSDKDSVTGDLQSFIEVYAQDGQLVWVRDEKDCKNIGIKAEALDGWYEGGQVWRCFKSSNPDVISHENLLVTRQKENKAVTITSCLSSDRFGRYEGLYPDACFKELSRQIVSASVIVKGTEPTHSGVVSEKSQVSFTLQTANRTWIARTTVYDLPEGTTVFDVFKRVLGSNNYTYGARGSYIYSITSPSGETLGEFDLGENSGWMYKVNGVIVDQYMNAQTVSNRDNIVVFFTKDYTEETGYGHSGGSWNGSADADKKAAASVDDLISAIGGVKLSSEKDIAAARAAYDKLTAAQKKLVSNYDILTAAEQALADLKAGKLPFTDVKAGAWYADAVKYVFDQGLMSGMSAQEFGPDGQVTRGQVVTILWRLAGSPTVSGKAFPDVSASAWYADAVAWASANGVVSGYENGGFGPGDPVTREQLAAILYRYAQLSGKDTDQTADLSGYTDSVTISAWAPQALKWAVGSGLISGTGTHTLSPRGTATRAQIAVILQNFCK